MQPVSVVCALLKVGQLAGLRHYGTLEQVHQVAGVTHQAAQAVGSDLSAIERRGRRG